MNLDLNMAIHNATVLYKDLFSESLKENDELTYGKRGQLKPINFIGKLWEALVDYLFKGSATRDRIQKVNELVKETFGTVFRSTSAWTGSKECWICDPMIRGDFFRRLDESERSWAKVIRAKIVEK